MSLVLVADDEPAVLEVLSEVVEELGHQVLRAHDGREALVLARAQRPCLVVPDHMMPWLSGLDLCRSLARDAKLKDVPVILLSAALPRGAVEEARACLAKPFELCDFERLVSQVLQTTPGRAPERRAPTRSDGVPRWAQRGLSATLGAARALVEEGLDQDPDRLRQIRRHFESLEQQINALEDFAQAAAGRLALAPEPGDLTAFFTSEVARWREEYPEVRIRSRIPSVELPLNFDPLRLRLALDQLLRNALLRAQSSPELELELSGGLVILRFTDFGPAPSPAEQQTMFERLPPGAPDEKLGLFLAFEVARLHGGALSVHSAPGAGNCFSFALPRR